jgi:CheY-like chemotaxis protein
MIGEGAARSKTAWRRAETVLIVDDDARIRAFVQTTLTGWGYTVLLADGLQSARRVCERHPGPIDLLFTDVQMPGGGGPEVARLARPLRPGVRVLFMSGVYDGEDLLRLDPDTPVVFLAKPFTVQALRSKVHEVVGARAEAWGGARGDAGSPCFFLVELRPRRGKYRERAAHPPPAPGDTAKLYRIDPLHPDLLVCETCAVVVCAVPLTPPAEPIDPAGSLTARQAIEAWPEIGPAVLVHDVACRWRELRTQPDWEVGRGRHLKPHLWRAKLLGSGRPE